MQLVPEIEMSNSLRRFRPKRWAVLVWNRGFPGEKAKGLLMGEKSISTIQIDNDRAQVSESRFPPGAETGFHRHEYDYVVVPLTTGRLKLIGPDGAVTYSELTAGQSYFRHAGVEHNVVNDNPFDFAFVEIQIK